MKIFNNSFGTKSIAVLMAIAVCASLLSGDKAEAAGKPAKPSITLAKRAKTKATIKIKKKGSVTGYHIAVATSKKGKYRIAMATMKRTVVLTKLKKNKVYYVKVRAYRTKGYRIQHGKYCKPIKIGKYKKQVQNTPTETPTETPNPEESLPPEETQFPEKSPLPDSSEQPEIPSPIPEPQAIS